MTFFGGYVHDVKVASPKNGTGRIIVISKFWASQKKTMKYKQKVIFHRTLAQEWNFRPVKWTLQRVRFALLVFMEAFANMFSLCWWPSWSITDVVRI